MEIGHYGDYPGIPFARINGHPIGDDQWRLLLSLFAIPNNGTGYTRRRDFFSKIGAKPINGSVEVCPLEGVIEIKFKPNVNAVVDTYKDHKHPSCLENDFDPSCQACAKNEN